MISDFLSSTTITDLNMASNFTAAIASTRALPIANKTLRISQDSLEVARKSLEVSIKLYNELTSTHDIEEERYFEAKRLQESYLDVMGEILRELKTLNETQNKSGIE